MKNRYYSNRIEPFGRANGEIKIESSDSSGSVSMSHDEFVS